MCGDRCQQFPICRAANRISSGIQGGIMQRRELLLSGAAAGIAIASGRALAQSLTSGDKLIPWTDIPPPVPEPLQNGVKGVTRWEDLSSWITPNDKWFSIAHYERPQIDPKTWQLEIGGLVAKPTALSLDQLKVTSAQGYREYDRMPLQQLVECPQLIGIAGYQDSADPAVAEFGFAKLRQLRHQLGVVTRTIDIQSIEGGIVGARYPWTDDAGTCGRGTAIM